MAAAANVRLGVQALRRGDLAQAEARARAALRLYRRLDPEGVPTSAHSAHLLLARVAERRGDAAQAGAHYAEGLRLTRLGGGANEHGRMLRRVGHFALAQGDLPRAAALLRGALARLREGGSLHNAPACLVGLAAVAAAQGGATRAARLCGAATAALAARYGRARPADDADEDDFERTVAAVQATLAEAAPRAAWAEGQATPLEQAIADALEEAQDGV